ncbi:MAG: helix-turn-helix transcriptional regulator [Chloroflexota bacterium]
MSPEGYGRRKSSARAKPLRRRTPPPRGLLAAAVGARVRALRQAKKMSAATLAAPYYTRAHISQIELGKIAPSLPALHHFAKKLGVPLRELIPREL